MTKDSGKSIAIAGAGVMGLSVAHALRSASPTLFDPKGFPADNASFMAGGMLAPFSEIEHLPENFIGAGLAGIDKWMEILPGVKRTGSLIVAHKDDEYILERLAGKIPATEKQDIKIAALEPALAGRFEKGIYIEREAHIDPRAAMKILGDGVQRRIGETADIESLRGKFDWVIDCRGIAADDKDLRGVKGEIVFVRNKEFSLNRPVRLMHPRYPLYIVPRADNIFMIGATIIESEDKNVTVKSALELLSAAYSLHPSFAEAEIVEIGAGVRPAYPDNLPRITIERNVIHCNGLFRHGWLLAPVIASCVTDYIEGRSNQFTSLFMGESHDHSDQRAKEKHQRRA